MPLILKMYCLPFKGLKTLTEKLIPSYELRKRRINKETQRKSYGKHLINNKFYEIILVFFLLYCLQNWYHFKNQPLG